MKRVADVIRAAIDVHDKAIRLGMLHDRDTSWDWALRAILRRLLVATSVNPEAVTDTIQEHLRDPLNVEEMRVVIKALYTALNISTRAEFEDILRESPKPIVLTPGGIIDPYTDKEYERAQMVSGIISWAIVIGLVLIVIALAGLAIARSQ